VEENTYTVDQAARVLKLTPGRIRQMLRAGELEGDRDEAGHWRIPAHAVHDRSRPPRVDRARSGEPSSEAREAPDRLLDLESEVRDLRYQLGLQQGRLELTEKAESTLRDALEREKERADKERERAEHAEQLQAELEEARSPWWRKLFGR
jgi:excisionase family DNA binding protein